MMGLHPISAGHGYTYLTRQVAAADSSALPAGGIGTYYTERGESPGSWLGSGLHSVGLAAGASVSEAQMLALFGEGRHPDAALIAAGLAAEGAGPEEIELATALGRPFELNLANNEFARQLAQLTGEWNLAHGQPWCADVPREVTARIRTAVAQTLFEQEHARPPRDAQELSGFVARNSRHGSKAVAGYDLTFSPVKSVSALWALAPPQIARAVEAAHHAAVEDAIAWLERTAIYSRLGRGGIRQVDVHGVIAAAFTHRASRAGDPDLHTHVAVSNKVATLDGRWRAIDGRVLFKAAVAASERYNTRLEAELRERLGVRFTDRAVAGRRPVREVVGMDERLLRAWSRRRAQIDETRAELSTAFECEHGRPPLPAEAIALAQQATLATRPAKHDPQSEMDQRRTWRKQAVAVLGDPEALDVSIRAATRPPAPSRGVDVAALGVQVVGRIQTDRAVWQRWHVIAEAQRAVRSLALPIARLDDAVDAIVEAALSDCSIALEDTTAHPERAATPEGLRRRDGSSVYTVAGAQLYTSQTVLDAERSILDAATHRDGRTVSAPAVEVALLESAANGLELGPRQRQFVRDLATSGARCQLALAPAGTGKTTTLRVLARAWVEDGGDIVAVAPSAAAARVLGHALGTHADTLAMALRDLDRPDPHPSIGPATLVVVDEAGMAGTADLARLVTHARTAGASVRLVGDDRQLSAVGAGGILRDLAETTPIATLSAAVRFADPHEAEATSLIRAGDHDGLDFYLDAQRVHVGDEHTATLSALRAWLADREAGSDSVLLAATREQVTALNRLAQAAIRRGDLAGPEVRLSDGCTARAGDAILTRHNDRRLRITATDWVQNGDRWTVHNLTADGAVRAVHRDTGRHVMLPACYVREHVALGYAVTIHAAQGSTADTSHTMITGSESREQLYVALSRGRDANHVHVALPGAADEHAAIRRDTFVPPDALDLLVRVLDREDAPRSATTELRALANPKRLLREAIAQYCDVVHRGAPAPSWSGPAPLPWLPPAPTCPDRVWADYVASRAGRVAAAAAQLRSLVERAPATRATADPHLRGDLAVWAVAHPVHDRAPLTGREAAYLRHLADRRRFAGGSDPRHPTARWLPLVTATRPQLIACDEWPLIAGALSEAAGRDLDVDSLLARSAARPSTVAVLGSITEAVNAAPRGTVRRNEAADASTVLPALDRPLSL